MGSPEADQSNKSNAGFERPGGIRRNRYLFNGDPATLRDFFLYFHPLLLDQARMLGIERELREEIVMTFLDDRVMELASMDLPPRSLTGYVVRGFRNRVRNIARDNQTRRRAYDNAAVEAAGSSQLVVAECHSEYGISQAHPDREDATAASEALLRLARFAKSKLSQEDVQLLIEVSRRVPLREVADWHKISYAACRTRIHRLRARTRMLTREYLVNLPRDERATVERFLRRAGALED